jgi:hypothetical protein
MRKLIVLSLLAVGCGGAPFTMLPELTGDDAQAPDAQTFDDALATPDAMRPTDSRVEMRPDAGHDAAYDASPLEASAPEAAPDVVHVDAGLEASTPEAAPYDAPATCTPLVQVTSVGPPATACNCSPSVVSGGRCTALGTGLYWASKPGTCDYTSVPSVCKCAESYSCACLLSSGNPCAFISGSVASCDDTTGTPIVTCH